MPLAGAMPGWPFEGLLNNGVMEATRATSLTLDEHGQESAGTTQTLRFAVYLKKANAAVGGRESMGIYSQLSGGVDPERVESLEGFADRMLPDWVLNQANIRLVSDDMGEGLFVPRPSIRPARAQVEAETGSYLYGDFIKNK